MWALSALIICVVLTTAFAMRSVIIDIDTFDVEFNRDIMRNCTLSLITVDKRRVFNGSVIPEIDMTSFDIFSSVTSKNRRATYFNITLNGCEFIAQSHLNPISLPGSVTNSIRSSIKNLPTRCPINKLTELVISNYYVNTDLMPFALIHSRFEFTLTISVQSTMGFRLVAGGVVGQKRKRTA